MANRKLALATNVGDDFFVDESCIDCDTCRSVAPSVFARVGDQSAVVRQPVTAEEFTAAGKAAVACPTSSIGARSVAAIREGAEGFPDPIDGDVFFCGYTAESSFGAHSYFVRHDDGNFMVDSPRFSSLLANRLRRMGGVRTLFLTHRDDVADHDRYHEAFDCRRIIHEWDAVGTISEPERAIRGLDPVELEPGLLAIPVPGHTRGSVVYLWKNYLFTGDHLAWSERLGHLYAFRSACWYSWSAQLDSMRRLLDYRFEWILPGHGRRVHLDGRAMRVSLERCIAWMSHR